MRVDAVKKLSPLERFIYFVRERYSVYIKRSEGQPRPWTDDEILQNYFFTNVHRENDKVTKFVATNIRKPLKDNDAVLFAIIAFRWFNYIPTGELLIENDLLEDWDLTYAKSLLNEQKQEYKKVFTGAFNISNGGSTKGKIERVCDDYIEPVWQQRDKLLQELYGATLATAHHILGRLPGMGGSGFMAAQCVCDLKYTHILDKATDWWSWCSPGPGSRRGLNILLGRDINAPVPDNWLEEITKLRDIVESKLPNIPKLHAQDIQSCLCELSKYSVALTGEGHMKRTYRGVV